MTKIIEVRNCPTCPHHNSDIHPEHYYCAIRGRAIKDIEIMTIPKWCPLPDKRDK